MGGQERGKGGMLGWWHAEKCIQAGLGAQGVEGPHQ